MHKAYMVVNLAEQTDLPGSEITNIHPASLNFPTASLG